MAARERSGSRIRTGFRRSAHLATVGAVTLLRFRPLRAAVVLALGLLAGCDNNTSAPTSPSGAFTVVGARLVLRTGETLPLSVTSAGAPATGVSWTTTDGSVAAVSATGVVTAGRAGRVTVTATSPTATGSIGLRVVPDFAGIWTGPVARLQVTCSASSSSPPCAPGAPTSGSMTLTVSQTGDQATATLLDSAEPTATIPLTGQVIDGDQLALAGRVDVPVAAPRLRAEAGTFRATYDPTRGILTGSYVLTVDRAAVAGGLQSDYRAQVQFRDLTRR